MNRNKGYRRHHSTLVISLLAALAWILLGGVNHAQAQWTTGTDIHNTNSGKVGVSTSAPRQQLSVGDNLDIYSGPVNSPTQCSVRASGGENLVVNAGSGGALYLNYDSGGDILFGNGSFGTTGVIKSSGWVGIGTTSPSFPLDIQGDTGANVVSTAYGAGAFGVFMARSARGALGSPSALQSGDTIGGFYGRGYGASNFAGSATYGVTGVATQNFTDTNMGTAIIFQTTPNNSTSRTEAMRIDQNGYVGLGVASPTARLDVNGSINVSGNINAKYQDVAEWVPATHALASGTVVVLNPHQSNQVMASATAYDTRVAGVVSERPGIALGEEAKDKVLVATTGRVKVKVDATRSPIHVGDLLVTSDQEGVAMKSEPVMIQGRAFHSPGTLIGKALEPLEKGTGEILVLLSLQ
jgi:hypothetical protein